MKMYQLAWQNVKSGLRSYLSLILSLAFTVMIFLNFQNMAYSDALVIIGDHNKDYSSMLVQTLSVVLGFFMVFFIGYATAVFLDRRKKEIGIYIFMGLTNQKIGSLYAIEMAITGIFTLAAGIGAGILTTQLFQMILLAMSDITVEIGFSFSIQPVLVTSAFYLAVYLVFVLKGYVDIVKSSVLDLVSAARQNEYVRQSRMVLMFKTILGTGLLSAGYYMAVKEGQQEVLENAVLAVVLVITGVYFLFGGLIPAIFQGLAHNKHYLYKKERNLWVNQMIFRMKKNYRTYAAVCVLMICSVTALAASFALKERYNSMVHFRNTYTYQLLSSQPDLGEKARKLIEQENEIAYSSEIPLLMLAWTEQDQTGEDAGEKNAVLLGWTKLRQLAEDTGLKFDIAKLKGHETVEISHLYLMSFYTKREGIEVSIMDRTFQQISEINEPYLGALQEQLSFYLVSDEMYEEMLPYGEQMYAYNYRIRDIEHYKASMDELDTVTGSTESSYTARIVTGPDSSSDWEWIKILYSLGVFLVMVFIMASGSILFMKLYNDAFEEKERYDILQKMGCSYRTLKRAAAAELLAEYALPFLVMSVSSYFSVHALENVMHASLTKVRLVSAGVIFVFLFLCYCVSVRVYVRNAGIRRE